MKFLFFHQIQSFAGKRPNQSAGEAMDRDGILYFGLMEPPSIWCWNTATNFSLDNFYPVAINNETLQFSSGVKIVNNLEGQQELWVVPCRYQLAATDSLRSDTINFRILMEKIPVILENNPCAYPAKRKSPCEFHIEE